MVKRVELQRGRPGLPHAHSHSPRTQRGYEQLLYRPRDVPGHPGTEGRISDNTARPEGPEPGLECSDRSREGQGLSLAEVPAVCWAPGDIRTPMTHDAQETQKPVAAATAQLSAGPAQQRVA
ncbi:hypothetical protein TREES_T100020648 [Tupaia chinensis]|uniref:Uncharacterized protein n=1 Tax=Tupaia chinensis TaxID=246437 RepID=L9KLD6_TUPCH|nr:hypothetical protein TREES_T100020648 [Tupaia chinensis]